MSTLFVLWAVAQALWAWDNWPRSPGGAWWAGLCAGLVAALLGCWWYRRPLAGRLAWERDGTRRGAGAGRWVWYSQAYRQGSAAQALETVLDLQHTMLVRLRNAEGRVWWLWLEAWRHPADWDDLRRAIGYSGRR